MTLVLRPGRILAALLILLQLAFAAPAGAQQPLAVPRLDSRVTDLTSTLSPAQAKALDTKLIAVQQRKGSEIAILIVPTTGADSIEQYTQRVFDQWKLGRKGVDDGVLVVVAKDDHTLRIQPGYGLEGAIPDSIAGRIIREQMTPAFRQGDFAGGLGAAIDSLIRRIDGEPLPPPPPKAAEPEDEPLNFMAILVLAIGPSLVVGGALRDAGLPMPLPRLGAGLVAGIIGWIVSGALLIGLVCAVGAPILSIFWLSGGGGAFSSGLGTGGFGRRGRGGWLGGGLGSGSSGGFGGGFGGSPDSGSSGGGFGGGSDSGGASGGFSGGGGSSGGGGASGSW